MIDQNIMTDKFASDILEGLSAKQKHLSKKYDLNEINDLATSSNFKTQHNFMDTMNYFTNSLLVKY